MNRKSNLTKLIQFWGVFFIIGVAVSITAIDTIGSYQDFKSHSEKMRADFITRQKQLLKQEIKKVVDFIYYEKKQSESLTRKKIKSRVCEAFAVADHIYQCNKNTSSDSQIQQMILNALRPIRFDNGNGYCFAIRQDGLVMLNANKPELEGKNMLTLQDTHGQHFIKKLIILGKRSGEGFNEYFWEKPGVPGSDHKKISFVKFFKPYGWIIGTGLYVDDVEAQIEANVLSIISRIRFGKEGYIFINKFNGDALISNGKLISGTKKLWEFFDKNPEKMKAIFAKEHKAALTPGGDYIYYSHVKLTTPEMESPKISFIYGIPDLQWLVGAGFYLDDVETDITAMQTDLTHHLKIKLFYFSLSALGILFFFLFVLNRLNRRLKNDINLLVSFFQQAAFSNESINRDLIQFEEFDRMTKNANKMLQDKINAQQELKDEKEALRKSEAKFRGLVETSYDWIWEINKDGVYTYASPQVESILGYKPDEVLGKTPFDFMPPAERKHIVPLFKARIKKAQPIVTLENVDLHKNGSRVTLETSGVPFFDDKGNLAGYRGVDRDITQRKAAEVEKEKLAKRLGQAQRMESIGLMAGGVAHDLNNILSGIVGYPDLLLQELPEDSDLKEPLAAIKESGERAAMVVADLLTVARGAASTREIYDLNVLIREYLDSPEFKKLKNLHEHVIYQPEYLARNPHIFCSSVHIKKCLMNLVINASEAIIEKGVVSITTRNHIVEGTETRELQLSEGEYVVVSVRDTGPGISRQDMDHIFEPFYTKKVMGKSGTGLGLTIVWNTLKDHNGKIIVESSDQGTCFQLYFPVSTEKNTSQIENYETTEIRGHGEHILIVDDDHDLRDIASKMLQFMGYAVDSVESGELAVEFVKDHPVDLVVIDMIMDPGMNGRQTYEKILALYPGQKAVITSGFSKSADVTKTIELGASGYIKKPYSMYQLGCLVAEALSR
jgi:PAS domain S-box-containing protein